MRVLVLLACLAPWPALADVLVPLRTIRAQSIVTAADFRIQQGDVANAYPTDVEIAGLEARVSLYAGRPVRIDDLGPPALVGRNDLVTLIYDHGVLQISTEGRALSRGGLGDTVRVMNLSSRTTVSGQVLANRMVKVR